MHGSILNHVIDPRNLSIPFKSIGEVRNELLIYFNQYQGLKFVCVKDEDIVGKNYKCLKQILVTIPNDICIITHIELFEMICKHYNVPLPQEHSSILSSTHKQLDTCQRCSFHETIEKHYHCGLGDSRTTALMIIVEMNNLGISIENAEQLPTVKRISTTFSINKNNFLFINNSKYSGCKKIHISEILMTKVTFRNHQIQTCETCAFQYLLPRSDIESPEQLIVQNFLLKYNITSNTIIHQHLQSVIDSGDDNQVIVFLDDQLTGIFSSLSFNKYTCITKQVFLSQYTKDVHKYKPTNFASFMDYLENLQAIQIIIIVVIYIRKI